MTQTIVNSLGLEDPDDGTTRPKERQIQKRAFQIYHLLGSQRSYKAVAEQIGMSVSTIKNWSRKYRWRQRVQARNTHHPRKEAKHKDPAFRERLERTRKQLDTALARLTRLLKEGKLRASPKDLLILQRLRERLLKIVGLQTDPDEENHVLFILPDNGMIREPDNLVPHSQLRDYLDSIGQ